MRYESGHRVIWTRGFDVTGEEAMIGFRYQKFVPIQLTRLWEWLMFRGSVQWFGFVGKRFFIGVIRITDKKTITHEHKQQIERLLKEASDD